MSDTTADGKAAPTVSAAGNDRYIKLGIGGLLLGMFLGMMDNFIVSTALPKIVEDLGGLKSLAWVITAYSLAIAASTQVWGKLSDLYDRKMIYLLSVVLFLAGSMLCGLAQDMTQLIVFRTLQGFGAGGLVVGALSITSVMLTPQESAKVGSWTGLLMGVSLVGGPLIGGLVTDAWSWHWIFYINVPFGIVCVLATIVGVRLPAAPKKKVRIDYLGMILLTAGVVCLTLVTTWAGNSYAWGSTRIIGLITAGVIALAALVWVQQRVAEPILPLRLFRHHNFTLAQILGFIFGVAMVVPVTFLPLYAQNAKGISSISSGLLLLPMMVGMVLMMRRGSAWIRRTGRFRILPIIGSAAITVGMVLLLLFSPGTNTLLGALYMVPIGVGLGCLIQNTVLITRTSVEPRDMGAAMGVGSLTRTLGTGMGVALFGALYAGRLSSSLSDKIGSRDASALVSSGSEDQSDLVSQMPARVQEAWASAVTDGLHVVAIAGVVAGVIALVSAVLVREVPLGPPPAPPQSS
ncbi:MFS transporter [Streptomyces reniochalinae]|uniref:MFS transporter n=1 Tax=Streptomyces reniochalinae TaxID=2250578 RepID=A0A367EDM8_9ACTN|nr:MFS transporter [Streptomyces reniochalinae]RCG16174.1 MFS transporter [Streptomyces reniochalinae]